MLSNLAAIGPGRIAGLSVAGALVLAIAACSDNGGDPEAQVGPNPHLPPLQQYLLPPMHLARVVEWQKDEKPTVAQGLQIQALATGLEHPRSLYALPNGDILVVESRSPDVEPIKRPKDLVMGWI